MSDAEPQPGTQPGAPRGVSAGVIGLLGLVMAAAVIAAGRPALDAPWIQGDEYLFILDNPDVTGAGRSEPNWQRWLNIFGHVHEDLYQPVPIFTYAVEWALWGEQRVFFLRQTDVLLHALNGLLLWAVLAELLRRLSPRPGRHYSLLAWSLALLWALHPTLVSAYAADMGRTHILSATFALASLWLHLKALATGRWEHFAGSAAVLLLAMMSKPVAVWFVLIFALEWSLVGLWAALRSPRVYVVAAMCAFFTLLTLQTSAEAGLLEDAELALLGDPGSRSFLALWIYLRNIFAPLGYLATWYPPDIRTAWNEPIVWVGAGLAAAGAALAVLLARRASTRGVSVGLVWFGALLLPLIGLAGGRVAAAQDRYLYQPLMGLLLAIGVLLARWTDRGASRRVAVVVGLTAVAGAAMLVHDRQLCYDARTTLRRAQRVADNSPGDPRAVEMLVAALEFVRKHASVPERQVPNAPDFDALFFENVWRAAELAESAPRYFRDDADRSAFHRRLSYDLLRGGDAEGSLKQALRAADFDPDAPMTWTRLAHAYRALIRYPEARRAYERLERVLPDIARVRALRLTEFGDLLLYQFNRPDLAKEKFQLALDTDVAPLHAGVGLARCEIRAGEGIEGFRIITRVLTAEPNNLEARLVLGEYRLRSRHWDEATRVYNGIIEGLPAQYAALRGFHEACVQTGRWRDAAAAWEAAVRYAPNAEARRAFRSYLVWSVACAGDAAARQMAYNLLADEPSNRFACFARMLAAIRAGHIDEALEWVRSAEKGTPIPEARCAERAAVTLQVMRDRGELPAAAVIPQAAIRVELGNRGNAAKLLEDYLATNPSSAERAAAERLLAWLSETPPNP